MVRQLVHLLNSIARVVTRPEAQIAEFTEHAARPAGESDPRGADRLGTS